MSSEGEKVVFLAADIAFVLRVVVPETYIDTQVEYDS